MQTNYFFHGSAYDSAASFIYGYGASAAYAIRSDGFGTSSFAGYYDTIFIAGYDTHGFHGSAYDSAASFIYGYGASAAYAAIRSDGFYGTDTIFIAGYDTHGIHGHVS
ncbi:unnamed protein product, partial [Rotaria sp. Silwood2]